MRSPEFYEKQAGKMLNTLPLAEAEKQCGELFLKQLPDFPQNMKKEIYLYFTKKYAGQNQERVRGLASVIFFFEELDADLAEDEWKFLHRICSDYAGDIDLSLLNQLMSVFIDKGLL